MLALCLFAILASVQCAPREYSKMDFSIFKVKPVIEKFTAELHLHKFENGADMVLDSSGAKELRVRYAFSENSSSEFRAIIEPVFGYFKEYTCVEFDEISPKDAADPFGTGVVLVFLETEKPMDTISTCVSLEQETKRDVTVVSIMINGPACAKEVVHEATSGSEDSWEFIDNINDKYCR